MSDYYQYDPKRPDSQGGPGGQSGPEGQGNGQYQYGYRYDPNGGRPPRRGGEDWSEWIAIGILFLLPFGITQIIAVFWAIRKLINLPQERRQRYKENVRNAAGAVRDTVSDLFRQDRTGQGQPRQDPSAQSPQGEGAPQSGRKRAAFDRREAQRKAKQLATSAKVMAIAGGVMTGVNSLAAISELFEFLEYLSWGSFFFEDLAEVLLLAVCVVGGAVMLGAGLVRGRRAERVMNYLGYIGTNREVPLAHMAATFGVSVKALCKDLRYMLSKGILPNGYLDLAEGKLFLTDAGYRQPEQKKAPEQAPPQKPADSQAQEDDILRQIRQVNAQIPDKVMTEKINRIEEITGKILAYQKAHPEKEGQLRSFLNYYLPTTLKILRAYAQLDAQGVEGENISAAKARIEGMMDQVVYGFERQLDKLFQDDAMDITTDVEVLENMLKKDGLSDGGMGTMPM